MADSDISIFRLLEPLLSSDIYIGGEHKNAMAENTFLKLINKFPNHYEKKKYVQARISAILRDEFDSMVDGERLYEKYMRKKAQIESSNELKKMFRDQDVVKYQTILDVLIEMLETEQGYVEKDWQEKILEILLLIYPKYIYVFREVPVSDQVTGERFIDFMLVDASGYIDIVEIKRPSGKKIMTEHKYRNNSIPLRDLSGTVMQIEKYIYYLNRWGPVGENYLTNKYKDQLPGGLDIKVTNPNGIIIMGRSNDLSGDQLADFEVVKRKYKNVVDILTYDDLIERIKYIIAQIKKL